MAIVVLAFAILSGIFIGALHYDRLPISLTQSIESDWKQITKRAITPSDFKLLNSTAPFEPGGLIDVASRLKAIASLSQTTSASVLSDYELTSVLLGFRTHAIFTDQKDYPFYSDVIEQAQNGSSLPVGIAKTVLSDGTPLWSVYNTDAARRMSPPIDDYPSHFQSLEHSGLSQREHFLGQGFGIDDVNTNLYVAFRHSWSLKAVVISESLFSGLDLKGSDIINELILHNRFERISLMDKQCVILPERKDLHTPHRWKLNLTPETHSKIAQRLDEWITKMRHDFGNRDSFLSSIKKTYSGHLLRRCFLPCPESQLTAWQPIMERLFP